MVSWFRIFSGQHFSQLASGSTVLGLAGLFGDVEHLGDLAMIVPFKEVKAEYCAVAVGELANTALYGFYLSRPILSTKLRLGLFGNSSTCVLLVKFGEVQAPTFEVIKTVVDDNPLNPCPYRRVAPEIGELVKDISKRRLQHVFRVFTVSAHAQAGTEHGTVVPAVQFVLRRTSSSPAAVDKLMFCNLSHADLEV